MRGRSSREKLDESFQFPSLSLYSRENVTEYQVPDSDVFDHTAARTRPTLNSLTGLFIITPPYLREGLWAKARGMLHGGGGTRGKTAVNTDHLMINYGCRTS